MMMKKILLLMGIFYLEIAYVYAQVGINTQNPQGVLHIDSKGDTNLSKDTDDDIVVDSNGNMGIGTITPQAKLHIETGGTSAIPKSGFILKDGNEKNGRVLTTNDTGLATWMQFGLAPSIVGVLNRNNGLQLSYSEPNFLLTQSYIDLPPGKWIVNVVMVLEHPGAIGLPIAPESVWVRSTFANQGTLVPSSDIVGSSYVSGLGWKNSYGLIQGFIIIENKSANTVRYDYLVGSCQNNGPTLGYYSRVGGGFNEDNIVAHLLM